MATGTCRLVAVLDAGPMSTMRGPCDCTFQAVARTIFEGTCCTRNVCSRQMHTVATFHALAAFAFIST